MFRFIYECIVINEHLNRCKKREAGLREKNKISTCYFF